MKFLQVALAALCFSTFVQVSLCDFSLQEIKLKDILGGMFDNVRHGFMEALNNTKYEWNFIKALDEFTDKLSVGDLLNWPLDGGAAMNQRVLDVVSDGFKDSGVQKEILEAYKYLVKTVTVWDLLSIFTGNNESNLWTVFRDGIRLSFKDSTALDEMLRDVAALADKLTGTNLGAQERLKEQDAQGK